MIVTYKFGTEITTINVNVQEKNWLKRMSYMLKNVEK